MIEVIFNFINSNVSKKSIQHDNFMHISPSFEFPGATAPPTLPLPAGAHVNKFNIFVALNIFVRPSLAQHVIIVVYFVHLFARINFWRVI